MPEEQAEFVEIICVSFTETEIEHLEIYAQHAFTWVEQGKPFELASNLILDTLTMFEEGSDDE